MSADLSITKTDGVTEVTTGSTVTYTITVSNAGPSAVSGAAVVDVLPAGLSGTGLNTTTGTLAAGASQVFTVTATVTATAGSISNTATVTAPPGISDAAGNNSATDTDIVPVPLPAHDGARQLQPGQHDQRSRWQLERAPVSIRVNANQAAVTVLGQGVWSPTIFGTKQGAAFTFANNPDVSDALMLKATGGTTASPSTFLQVLYQSSGQVGRSTNDRRWHQLHHADHVPIGHVRQR